MGKGGMGERGEGKGVEGGSRGVSGKILAFVRRTGGLFSVFSLGFCF